MKRPNLLESLKELRERARESEELELGERSRAVRSAREAETRARELLDQELQRGREQRARERKRMEQTGVTAAEGARQLQWQHARRQRCEALSSAVERAKQATQRAREAEAEARLAVARAQAKLEGVETRLERQSVARLRKREQTQQEAADESSLRRFFGRYDA